VKSAQATFEQTTQRRLAELTNLADGKASKSELVQTAEELKSKIASVQTGSSRNYFRNSRSRSFTTNEQAIYDYRLFIVPDFWQNKDRLKRDYVRLSFDVTFPVALARDMQANVHFSATPWYSYTGLVFKGGTTERQHFEFTIDLSSAAETYQTNNVFIRFGTNYGFPAGFQVVIENAMLSVGNYYPAYQPAYEDQDERVSAVESSFKQRADLLEASVSSLREGLNTKADSSALTLLSDRILASVKSLETDTQNKLNSKLSTAEFEVRAGSIRQEILNATKDKADKALVTAEAGRLREELASLSVGGRNLLKGSKGPFKPNSNPANFDNQHLYYNETSIHLVQNEKYRISAKSDGNFSSNHNGSKESDNVVLWLMDKAVSNYQIVSDAKTGTTGTEFIWNRPTGTYHLRVNTYRKDPQKLKSVWEVKVEQGSFKTDWSPAPEDTEGLITEAKASFERTAQGLRTDLSAVQAYVNTDGTRSEALHTFSREETARQLAAERKLVEASYVGKATYAEDVKGISRRFEELNSGGPNLVSNGATELGLKYWAANGKLTADRKHPFFKNSTATMFVLDTTETAIAFMQQNQYNVLKRNTDYTLSFTAFASSNVSGFRALVGLLTNMDHAWKKTLHTYTKSLSPTQAERITVQFNSGDYDGFALQFDNMGSSNGRSATVWISEIDVYEGTMKRPYQPSPANGQGYADTKLAEFRQGIDGQLATVQTALNTANSSLTSFNNWKQSAQETLNKVGRVESSLNETKTSFAEFKQTAEGQLTTITQQVAGKASQTDFQRVQETSKLYERLIGSTEKEVTDKVSRMALTNELFQVEVSKNLGLRTVQYQMANAWAVQNLNSKGDIVSQINATGPNVRIQGESIHLDGKTLIDNGIIKNAMIESMLADKITAGTLNAANVNIINLNANKIVGLDANFIKSKIELALVEWLKGKVITAQNDAMKIDLNNGQYNVMTDQAAIRRVLNGYPNQFLKFTSETEGGAPASVTVLGANRDGTENSKNDSFAGIRLFSGNKVERTEIISDVVRFATGAVNYRGWEMRTLYGNDNRQVILQPFGNVTRSNIVANYFNGIDLVNVLETLNQMMANLANHTGRRDIFGPIPGLGARKYQR
jgi:pblB